MKLTRRACLLGGAGLLGTGTVHLLHQAHSIPTSVMASVPGRRSFDQGNELLVVVFLRGGCDGLNLVAPVDDPDYVAARPTHLRIQGRGPEAGLPLANAPEDLDFRLHSAAPELKDLYDEKALAIVHACGLTNGTRSHFEAQALMELGTATDKGLSTGWLTRMLIPPAASGLIPAVAISSSLPISLLGSPDAVSMADLEEFIYAGEVEHLAVLNQLYQGSTVVHTAGMRMLESLQAIASTTQQEALLEDLHRVESYSDDYGFELGRGLRAIATLARLDVGLKVATLDYGDWDTHADQAWQFEELVTGLSRSLSAFYEDMRRDRSRVTILVMTEFGRRLRANQSEGTDHGFGSVMLTLGDRVNGGRIYGQWPGLATEQLDRGTDLAITTDFRRVLAEYLSTHAWLSEIEAVFPNLPANEPLGIFNDDVP